MSQEEVPMRVRWARLRFSIIGPLLAAPPEPGELATRVRELASKSYVHPTTKLTIRFGTSTIERWYYDAKDNSDPIRALERKVPSHAGTHPGIHAGLAVAIANLYRQHPSWTVQLHYDNLLVVAKEVPTLGVMPSYATVRRYMRDRGLIRLRKPRHRRHDHEQTGVDGESTPVFELREKRSFEVTHVHALWHLDFHVGSRKVLTASGEWNTPMLLGILDDHSRLCCHLQWYLDETAESLVHGLSQAIQKRGRPRALMSDNGAAMLAAETTEGLERLGIIHETTLAYTPEQNAKQECFWAQVEGRLMAMLEGELELSLTFLNDATQAWVEQEYQRHVHSEIGEPPIERALTQPECRAAKPKLRGAASGLSDGDFPNATTLRRHHHGRRCAVRDPNALSNAASSHHPLRPLGPIPCRPRRRQKRRPSLHVAPFGQSQKRRPASPGPRPNGHRGPS